MSRNRYQLKSDGILSKIGVNASTNDSKQLNLVFELTERLSADLNVDRRFIEEQVQIYLGGEQRIKITKDQF